VVAALKIAGRRLQAPPRRERGIAEKATESFILATGYFLEVALRQAALF
jgi:hypothetical protein